MSPTKIIVADFRSNPCQGSIPNDGLHRAVLAHRDHESTVGWIASASAPRNDKTRHRSTGVVASPGFFFWGEAIQEPPHTLTVTVHHPRSATFRSDRDGGAQFPHSAAAKRIRAPQEFRIVAGKSLMVISAISAAVIPSAPVQPAQRPQPVVSAPPQAAQTQQEPVSPPASSVGSTVSGDYSGPGSIISVRA